MRIPHLAAVCGLLLGLTATMAEARVDNGLVMSMYGEHEGSSAKPSLTQSGSGKASRRTASRNRHVAKGSSAHRHADGGGEGGGTSRACLQSAARELLNRIEAQFGPVDIVSTCRPGAVIATSGKPSKHRYGLAIDFRAPGRKAEIVRWLIANHHDGGTMTYRDMDHIHVDIGYHFVSLGAPSGHGRRSRA